MSALVTISHRAATGCGSPDGVTIDPGGFGDGTGQALTATLDLPPHTLLDMPTHWIEQLARVLPPASCLAVLRTCHAMRDLVLSQRDLVVHIMPVRGHAPQLKHTLESRLELACKHSSRVKLVLNGSVHGGTVVECRQLFINAVDECCGLEAITSVVLKDLTLDGLVPPWLITTCPNMHRLELNTCHFHNLPHPIDAIPSAPQLKHLHLDMTNVPQNVELQEPGCWQHQFGALPNLNSLTIEGWVHIECVDAVRAQLTRLAVPYATYKMPWMWDQAFPFLREVVVGAHLLDADVEALISLPSLRVVHCKGLSLRQSYTDCPCTWTELGFTELDMASFDLLPLLEDVTFVPDAPEGLVIIPTADLAATQRVAAKLGGWGEGVSLSGVRLENKEAQADSTILAAILPMLSACKCACLTLSYVGPVTPELLAAMGQHLSGSRLASIEFVACSWAPAVWPVFLPSLPAGVDVVFSEDNDLSEAHVIVMCVHACRPVSVYLEECCESDRAPERSEQAVQAAMAAAGHQHVQLCIDGDYDPASDVEAWDSDDYYYNGTEDESEGESGGEGAGEDGSEGEDGSGGDSEEETGEEEEAGSPESNGILEDESDGVSGAWAGDEDEEEGQAV